MFSYRIFRGAGINKRYFFNVHINQWREGEAYGGQYP